MSNGVKKILVVPSSVGGAGQKGGKGLLDRGPQPVSLETIGGEQVRAGVAIGRVDLPHRVGSSENRYRRRLIPRVPEGVQHGPHGTVQKQTITTQAVSKREHGPRSSTRSRSGQAAEVDGSGRSPI